MSTGSPKLNDSYLVTGGAGFIGSNFVELAVQAGSRVTVLDKLTYAGHKANLQGIQGAGSFELVEGDICDSELLARLFKQNQFQAVLNFAAESHVDRSISEPGEFIETNIKGTFNLLRHALEFFQTLPDKDRENFRFLHVSTDEVYGELGETGKFSESTPYAPNSPYSASKASADFLVRAWNQTFGLPTVTTNCSNNYGPRQYPEKLIPLMVQNAVEGKPLPVYGDGTNIRDWIHVTDHCQGIMLALTKGKNGDTYCFGGDSERNNLQVVKSLCTILDSLKPRPSGSYADLITFVEDRKGHDFRYAIDDSKAQKELGFTRQYSDFEQGLKTTIEWYLENQKWCGAVLESNR